VDALKQAESAGTPTGSHEAVCAACGAPFKPRREWQKFCSTPCRQAYHAKLTPEALRRDLDELRKRVAELEAK
jgi:hypothetical protein